MLYFAELSGRRVHTSDGATIGKLTDVYFLGATQPLVTKLGIDAMPNPLIVPITSVKTLNGDIILSAAFETAEVAENELSVRKNLLDQQIIDIKGNKVVRVNDVVIQDKPYFVIAGVDVGLLGIARWLKIEQVLNKSLAPFGTAITSNFLPWEDIQPVELSRGKVVLKREETKLTRIPPEDLADHLERISVKNLTKILDLLPSEYEAEVIQNLNVTRQRALFRTIKPERAAQILSRVDPDEAVDILLSLSERRRGTITPLLSAEAKAPIDYLMSLSHTDIGGLATSEYIAANPDDTVGKIKTLIKTKTSDFFQLSYVYVINKNKELVGVCNLHELLLQENDTPIYKFMIPNVITISLKTPKELAIKKMLKYKIYALPIINGKREILGVVTIDDLMETVMENLI